MAITQIEQDSTIQEELLIGVKDIYLMHMDLTTNNPFLQVMLLSLVNTFPAHEDTQELVNPDVISWLNGIQGYLEFKGVDESILSLFNNPSRAVMYFTSLAFLQKLDKDSLGWSEQYRQNDLPKVSGESVDNALMWYENRDGVTIPNERRKMIEEQRETMEMVYGCFPTINQLFKDCIEVNFLLYLAMKIEHENTNGHSWRLSI